MPILGLITRFVLAGAIGLGGALGVAALTAPPTSNLLPAPRDRLRADRGHRRRGRRRSASRRSRTRRRSPSRRSPTTRSSSSSRSSSPAPSPAPVARAGRPGSSRPATRACRRSPSSTADRSATANCTMASGAMLARLGYGIVTTGSQLRALQPDQEGGTSLADLQVAIGTWGVSFSQGAISPLQLRALLYAGAGAVVQVNYGTIPVSLRLQADFTGGHAIYLDGFRPAGARTVRPPTSSSTRWGPRGPGTRAPGGRPTSWRRPRSTFGGGTAYTAWAFPGGTAPANPPPLPPSAFPEATLAPGVTPNARPRRRPCRPSPPLPSPAATLAAPRRATTRRPCRPTGGSRPGPRSSRAGRS